MTMILQYIGFGILGYMGGLFVNFFVEWFYIRRKFHSEEEEKDILELGWIKYLTWPFSSQQVIQYTKFRIIVVEILFIGLFVWIGIFPPVRVEFWWAAIVLIYFSIVIVMDIEYRVVLHPISAAGIVLGGIIGTYLWGLQDSLIGGVIGFIVMFLLYKFGELFMRWVNKRRGEEIDEVALGFGDVALAAVIGLFLGTPTIILGLLAAILLGGLISIIFILVSLVLRKFQFFAALPYAPFLAIVTVIILFYSEAIGALLS